VRWSVVVAALLVGGCYARSPKAPETSVPASPDSAEPDDGPTVPAGTAILVEGELLDAVEAALANASQRIDVAQYTLWESSTTSRLYDALALAASRGVAVRVLADEEADTAPDVLAQLEAAGAEVQLDSPDVTLHTKLWVVDDVAFIGSHNLSSSALSSNREVSARLTDPEAVALVETWFNGVWADSASTPEVPSASGTTRPVFDRTVLPAVLGCIEDAEVRVRVAMYAFAWDPDYLGGEVDQILQALVGAHQRGVDVQVLLDGSSWIVDNGINQGALDQLWNAGVNARVAEGSEVVHAKALVCDDTALVSDANWSYSGLVRYHGASVALQSDRLADDLAEWIEALHAAGHR
jgi:phosphatidylserine/phosphatidylglycerophosphate/cardiolipin synthase-like enzyme